MNNRTSTTDGWTLAERMAELAASDRAASQAQGAPAARPATPAATPHPSMIPPCLLYYLQPACRCIRVERCKSVGRTEQATEGSREARGLRAVRRAAGPAATTFSQKRQGDGGRAAGASLNTSRDGQRECSKGGWAAPARAGGPPGRHTTGRRSPREPGGRRCRPEPLASGGPQNQTSREQWPSRITSSRSSSSTSPVAYCTLHGYSQGKHREQVASAEAAKASMHQGPSCCRPGAPR